MLKTSLVKIEEKYITTDMFIKFEFLNVIKEKYIYKCDSFECVLYKLVIKSNNSKIIFGTSVLTSSRFHRYLRILEISMSKKACVLGKLLVKMQAKNKKKFLDISNILRYLRKMGEANALAPFVLENRYHNPLYWDAMH